MSIPVIEPIASAEAPELSVMLPAWNAGRFLRSTLESVLAAGPPPGTQIEVVDDGSTDDTADIARTFADRGVAYHLNGAQKGASANFNVCIQRSRGKIVHLLHADDQVLPGFYEAVAGGMTRTGVVAAFTRAVYIDDLDRELTTTRTEAATGVWTDAVKVLAVSNRVRPPAIAVRRSAYEAIGGFREDLHHAADWEMWMRLAVSGPIWFVDRPLARYRVHEGQDSSQQVRTAANITERVAALEMIVSGLPADQARRSLRGGLFYSSAFAGRTALGFVRKGEWGPAWAQALAAGRCGVAGVTGWVGLARRGAPPIPQVSD
jgi:GT2 family glycosyltransferase